MPLFDVHQIANLVQQLGGNHQQAAQQLQNMQGQQVDPNQHSDMLQNMGIDPQQLQNGGYDQHINAQSDPGFQGYQAGDLSQQGGGGMGQDMGGAQSMAQGQQSNY